METAKPRAYEKSGNLRLLSNKQSEAHAFNAPVRNNIKC